VSTRRIVIVGAGLAGARVAETLRARGFDGRVVVVGDEPVGPYERPALSKGFLAGARDRAGMLLRAPSFWASQEIDLRLGERVVAIDHRRRIATTSRGRIRWDSLVLATGARPRRPPSAPLAGVLTLRTMADAEVLRRALVPGARLAVVGGGFVGTEVASTAAALGVEVTILEAGPAPLARVLGEEVGALLADRIRAHGVELWTDVRVTSIERGRDGRGVTVAVADGRRLPADVALLAVGVDPDRDLVPPVPVEGVYACGDVAGIGHWTSAAHGGVATAHAILGLELPPPQPRYVWSDQFGLRLQLVGEPQPGARVELDGRENEFSAGYRSPDGRLVAALAANRPQEVARLRRELRLAA